MLTKTLLSRTVALAMTASLTVLAGCPTPTTNPSASVDPSAAASVAPSVAPTTAASVAPSVAPTTATSSATTAPTAAATATITTNPSGDFGTTKDVSERATFNGKVYDPNGVPVDGATVNAKSVDAGVNWTGESQVTVGGAYVFRNAPVGARIAITETKEGWTTRSRSEVLKSNLQGDPTANVFDFSTIYAIQDEPEVTMLKINGRQVNGSSNGDVFTSAANAPKNSKPTPGQLDNGAQITNVGNVASLTGVNSNTLEVEMTFSEPVKVDDVRNYFRVTSQSGFDNRSTSFSVDANYSGVEFVVSADEKTITFKTSKAILANKGGDEARYLVDFSQAFRDKTDKAAIDRRYFRFSPSQINDFSVFSVKNDEEAPKLLGIVARDGGSANDTIELRYSEPMELINQSSYAAGLSDPLSSSNLSRQLWYRDANTSMASATPVANVTSDNNATLVGFLNNSDTDPAQFRASYMIGRILSSEISNQTGTSVKTSILGSMTRTPSTTPIKGNTTANDLLRNARVTGSNVLLEFSPTAFDRDDRVVVSVGNRITGNFVDRNRTPSLNDDLSVSTSGNAVEYASIYDPAGRLIDTGNSSTSANIDVNNGQRVATAS